MNEGLALTMRHATDLTDLAAHGGRYALRCTDGFGASVIAFIGAYCQPRPDWGGTTASYNGPFRAVEVGFPTERPEPWEQWQDFAEEPDNPAGTVYAYVPVGLVADLIERHGGEA